MCDIAGARPRLFFPSLRIRSDGSWARSHYANLPPPAKHSLTCNSLQVADNDTGSVVDAV